MVSPLGLKSHPYGVGFFFTSLFRLEDIVFIPRKDHGFWGLENLNRDGIAMFSSRWTVLVVIGMKCVCVRVLSLGLWSIAKDTCLLGKTPLDWCRSAWFFIASSVVVLHFLTDEHPILVVFHNESNHFVGSKYKVLIVCPAILQTLPPHFFRVTNLQYR